MCKNYKPTIMSAVDELQRAYKALNKEYFGNALEDVIITIQTDPRKQAYAWISIAKTWNDKAGHEYREINMVAEWLNRPSEQVIASLLHEMCHLWNMQKNIQDTSRNGSYHNTKFKEAAETHGLKCAKSEKYGWCITSASEELKEWVEENTRKGCFRFRRKLTWADGSERISKGKGNNEQDENGRPAIERKGKSNIIKYICPKCGMIVRTSKNADNKIMCIDCKEILKRA